MDSNGTHTNPHAWNRVANMLYLESPAGCDDPIGFSCVPLPLRPAADHDSNAARASGVMHTSYKY